jgi:hypothetical protein
MGDKRTGGALLVWAAELLDLPADVVAGLPRITLTGSRALSWRTTGAFSPTENARSR